MKGIRVFAVFTVVVALGFASGFSCRDIKVGTTPSTDAFAKLLGGGLSTTETPTSVFSDHFNLIQSRFYRDVNPASLKYSGMRGLVASLGDPNTMFMEPRDAEDFSIETRGNYGGVGARLGSHPLGARVATIFPGGPADDAGLQVGDVLTAVDGNVVKGMIVDDIVQFIRGEKGTPVELTVMRADSGEEIDIKVVRDVVIVPTSEGKMLLDHNVGYISVSQFSQPTFDQFSQALRAIHAQNPDGLVIDLRQNRGGLLNTTVDMLSLFLDQKLVVTMEQKNGKGDQAFTARGRTLGINYPIVILVNGMSASASEIFSGALRDYRMATLVGENTYGKASVQNAILLRDLSSVKITTGRYILPGGENISRVVDEDGVYVSGGIKPHVTVELEQHPDFIMGEPEVDNQLRAAIDIVKEKAGS